jgi:hypothetical protein
MSKRWAADCRVMRHVPEYRNPQLYLCEHLKTRVAILPAIYNGTLLLRMTVSREFTSLQST